MFSFRQGIMLQGDCSLSQEGPLCVSGFDGMSLYDDYDELSMEDRFADTLCRWIQDPSLAVPYMAMLQPMNDFDKQGKLA